MPAKPVIVRRRVLFEDPGTFVEMVAWRVSEPVPPCSHFYKYSLVYIADWKCALRYDNERVKGDHKHVGDVETPLQFTTLPALVRQFVADVKRMRGVQP